MPVNGIESVSAVKDFKKVDDQQDAPKTAFMN